MLRLSRNGIRKWKSVFQKLVGAIVIKTWSGKGAISIGRRVGLPGPALSLRRKARRGAAVGDALEMAKTLGRLQDSLFKMSLKRGTHRRGAALHRKMPRRDIGKGHLVASGSAIVCRRGVRFSCYLRGDVYTLLVCDVATSLSVKMHLHVVDAPMLAKGFIQPQDDEDFESVDPPISHICHHLLRCRTWPSFARVNSVRR